MRLSEWHYFSASAYVSPGPDLTMVAYGDILVFRGIRRKERLWYITTRKTIALSIKTFVSKVMSLLIHYLGLS